MDHPPCPIGHHRRRQTDVEDAIPEQWYCFGSRGAAETGYAGCSAGHAGAGKKDTFFQAPGVCHPVTSGSETRCYCRFRRTRRTDKSLPTFPWLRTRITMQTFACNSRTRIRTRLPGHRGLSLRILPTGRRCHFYSTALHAAADALFDVLYVPGGLRAASRTGLGPCVGNSCRAGSDRGSLALRCPPRLRLHNLTHILTPKEEAMVWQVRTERRMTDRVVQTRRLLPRPPAGPGADAPAPPPVRSRSFFMARAAQAVQRLGSCPDDPRCRDEVRRIYGLMSELFARNPRCEYCQVLMVPAAGSSPYGPNTILPSMPSLDAIHLRSRGGTYAHDNCRLFEVGCNFVKLDLTADETAVLIGRLEAGRVLDVDVNGMLCPATRSRVDKDTMFTIVVEAWARRTVRLVRQHNRQQHRHSADITVAELVRIAKDRTVTEHTYRDASGVELPLYLSSIDRIDPDGAYAADNVRLFIIGRNVGGT